MATDTSASADLPSISVVTPSFNQARFLERTIRSVIDQGYPRLEYIILDGGSTDGSVAIIRRYSAQLTHWESRPDRGQSAAINAGWAMATGDVLAWINSDDFYLPGALRTVGEFFRDHPDAKLVYGACEIVDPDGSVLDVAALPLRTKAFRRGEQMLPQPSTFVARTVVDQVGPLDESLHYAMDFDLFLRSTVVAEPAFLPARLSAATLHPSAKTTANRAIARQEVFRVAARYAPRQDRAMIRLLAARAYAYHRLPAMLRKRLDRLRRLPVVDC